MQAGQGQAAADASRELLTYTLGSEEYGIDILKVQEIRGYEAVTTIANAPEFIKGVINLRGIIVLNVANRIGGMVVDGGSDVPTLKADEINPAPEFGASLDVKYLQGLGTADQRMIILVDIEKL